MRRALVTLTAVLALTATALPAGASPGTPVQKSTVGSDVDGFPAIVDPIGIAADNAGGLALATQHGALRLATSGEVLPLTPTPPTTSTPVYFPDGNRAYVGLNGDTHLQVQTSAGAPILSWDLGGASATAVAVDPTSPWYGMKVLYVLTDSGIVEVLDPSSTSTDPAGALANDFPVRGAIGMAVNPSDHSLLLLDSAGTDVLRYTQQGIYTGSWPLRVSGETNPSAAKGIAVDASGTVFAADALGHRVLEFTSGGTYLGLFGDTDTSGPTLPASPGQLDGPTSLTVDCLGRLWVLDVNGTNKGRVVEFTGVAARTGTCAAEKSGTSFADDQSTHVATDRAGNVYTSAYGVLRKTDVNGHRVLQWGSTTPTKDATGQFGFPNGLATTSAGDVLVGAYQWIAQTGPTSFTIDYGTPRILQFHATGTLGRTITNAHLTSPALLVVRPSDGHVFVYNSGLHATPTTPAIEEYDAGWVWQREITLPTLNATGAVPTATSMTFDTSKHLVVAVRQRKGSSSLGQPLYDAQLFSLPSSGPLTQLFAAPASFDSAESPSAVVALPDGSWVLGVRQAGQGSTSALFTVSSSGVLVRHVEDGLLGDFTSPHAALDCRGRLVVTDAASIRTRVLSWVAGKLCSWKATALTGSLVSRTTTTLKVRGASNPASQVTRLRFLYGATSSHGKYTPWITLPSDNVQLSRDVAITGLLTKHTYHYAVQVTNTSGTVTGADRTATTS